jgi:hypothetical protein
LGRAAGILFALSIGKRPHQKNLISVVAMQFSRKTTSGKYICTPIPHDRQIYLRARLRGSHAFLNVRGQKITETAKV